MGWVGTGTTQSSLTGPPAGGEGGREGGEGGCGAAVGLLWSDGHPAVG